MEIRCRNCNKLFRVSDDKITGKGIKFACTRCGESVKITKEDFENYTLSQTAVTALDLFDPNAKPAAAGPETPKAEVLSTAPEAVIKEAAMAKTAASEPKNPDLSSSSAPDFLQEREEPLPPSEPAPSEASSAGGLQPAQEPSSQSQPAKEMFQPLSQPAATPAASEVLPETKQEAKPGPELKPAPKPTPEPEPMPVLKSESKSEPVIQPKTGPKPAVQPKSGPVRTPVAPAAPGARPAAPVAAKKEPARPAAPTPPITVIGASPPAPSRSGSSMIILVVGLILVLMGFGVFMYLRSSPSTVGESTSAMTSVAGLQILNASGSLESDGDLLISGVVENTTDKEKNAWYIVVDIFDANGAVMNKIRLLNGKQLFTRNDYEILASRGVNVQELKAKTLQDQGVVVPPKGKVAFEIRYLQPPIGVASFNASLHPFDPVRLYKEIAEEAK